jgi:Holliday junction resolvase RusA-like endonuclease
MSGKVLFNTTLRVDKFAIKKNSKQIFMNKKTGNRFIASNHKAKHLEDMLTHLLIKERLKQRLDTYTGWCNAKLVFHFPATVFNTKKGTFSHRVGDLSNLFEAVTDSLQKAQIIENDRMIFSFNGSHRTVSSDSFYWLSIELTEL